ncbi:uncharacterized protein LOC128740174 [Sabethes cyaneus]|uniref:uncharacterized protein LOC128740174 n=1 Tax=Sabethes cyaneus TaxID=53552 RepID=UPI00237EA0C6|nr:uncharacterized protein LOC128740174 [Sabethes cyaneus]
MSISQRCKKGVERAFGVLMARFSILKNPARLWHKDDLKVIMRACIILHNMIIESERDVEIADEFGDVAFKMGPESSFQDFLDRHSQVYNADLHHQLQDDLIEDLWKMKGVEE